MKTNGHLIKQVDPGSFAEAAGIRSGDKLLSINGHLIEDIFDYEYYMDSPSLTLLVEKEDGSRREIPINHDYQDLGLTFENGLFKRSCTRVWR